VGPATFKTLAATPTLKKEAIYGEDSGNGEALARYILDHYSQNSMPRASLLFPVGEQRRDIIPKTLMDTNLVEDQRIQVKELTVYETGVMKTFEENFKTCLRQSSEATHQWVVVFSPTGCEATLRSLDLLDSTSGKAKPKPQDRKIFLATIGPTTRDILINDFGFEPDVCAETPSAEGIGQGISRFMELNTP
jgi:uroporphyrinogen-III synthase